MIILVLGAQLKPDSTLVATQFVPHTLLFQAVETATGDWNGCNQWIPVVSYIRKVWQGYLLQLMYIFTTVLSFLTRPFTGVLVLVKTWSSLTSTSSLTLDRPTWIQLVLLLSNMHPLLPWTYLLGLHAKSFLNLVITGTRGCACLRVLSVANFMFAASASYLDTKIMIVHQNSEAFPCPLYADSLFCHLTFFKPPQFMLGAAKKWLASHVALANLKESHGH